MMTRRAGSKLRDEDPRGPRPEISQAGLVVRPLADRSSVRTGRANEGLVNAGRTVSYPTNNKHTNFDLHVTDDDCYRSDTSLYFRTTSPGGSHTVLPATVQQHAMRRSGGRKGNKLSLLWVM
jgi:hypothetical protein